MSKSRGSIYFRQIHELKYILVSFFGLTEDELEEIQKDGFAVRDIEHPDKLI